MISDNLPKNIANELNKKGLTADIINPLTPDNIFVLYCQRLSAPFKAEDLIALYDGVRLSNSNPMLSTLMQQYGIPTERPSFGDLDAMSFVLSYVRAEYENWGQALTTLLLTLRKAFKPYETPKTTYASCPEIHTLEINNNAVFFSFNCKKKLFNDEQNGVSTRQLFMSVESRANNQYLSSLLSLTEITQFLMALEDNSSPRKTEIAKRATSSVVFEIRDDMRAALYHNSKQGNHFINLTPLDQLMLKGKCIEVLKRGFNMTRGELYHLIER
ncbi:hypothetical protein [Marinomonas algarum]|uniref:Uncharacterized protein n=1 Tax=Marinomonas algarum TaxID=2883105 RepID=A0A9X1RU69_9GAMM|nr:hypothetical protein [Marinomonas algarum]MCB5162981.1 hypothetical protein [Marinomonas algarum]